jgi:YgiT-type zinc finger domain-containing protein
LTPERIASLILAMTNLVIKTCPTCGSNRIRRVKRDIESKRAGQNFIAQDIEIEECANCGERLFSPESLEQIAAQRAERKRIRGRRSA